MLPNQFEFIRNNSVFVCYGEDKKPRKPSNVNELASPVDPSDWGTYDAAFTAFQANPEIIKGIGVVLTPDLGLTCIDLDDTDDLEVRELQNKVYENIQTYTEFSPSGKGCHLWVRGKVKRGIKRNKIEMYSELRYMTLTGNVIRDMPIEFKQDDIDYLFDILGGNESDKQLALIDDDCPQKYEDDHIIQMAANAANGELFIDLYQGNWHGRYSSQSEADQAMFNILCFYTQNKQQVIDIFLRSELGKRPKAQRQDYLNSTFRKGMDRHFSTVSPLALQDQIKTILVKSDDNEADEITIEYEDEETEEVQYMNVPSQFRFFDDVFEIDNMGGLMGEIARFFYKRAPRPNKAIAFCGAVAFMAGVCGKPWQYGTTGLNFNLVLLARTGFGKDAVASGISALTSAVTAKYSSVGDEERKKRINSFFGITEIASKQALHKYIAKESQCFTAIMGEFGEYLSEENGRENPHKSSLRRAILDVFSKSGHHDTVGKMIYSDSEKNSNANFNASVSFFAESNPEDFYKSLTTNLITKGFLPRFAVIEVPVTKRAPLNEDRMFYTQPTDELRDKVDMLMNTSLDMMDRKQCIIAEFTPSAKALFKEFGQWVNDYKIDNPNENQFVAQLWNRAELLVPKLASLYAVGLNYHRPIIDETILKWAITIIVSEKESLHSKFKNEEVGITDFEAKLIERAEQKEFKVMEMIDEFKKLSVKSWPDYKKAHFTKEQKKLMIENGYIPWAYILQKLKNVMYYRTHKLGISKPIKEDVDELVKMGILSAAPPDVALQLGYKGTLYKIN